MSVVDLPEASAPTFPPEACALAPAPFQVMVSFFSKRTEAPPSFLLYSLATWAGAMIGRWIHNRYASDVFPLLFTILVAPAGRRKTSSDNFIRQAIFPPGFHAKDAGVIERRGTIGSGPALLEVLESAESELGNGATTLWRPPEWSSVLRAAEREGGRDLVPILLGAYDGLTDYTHSVRNKKPEKSGVSVHLNSPGLAVISTAQESMLRAHLTAETVGLGLASRLLLVYHGAPVPPVPFPERAYHGADWTRVNAAAEAIREAATRWRAKGKQAGGGIEIEIPRGGTAEEEWERWYRAWYDKTQVRRGIDAERASERTARVPEYCRRLAMIRAAMDERSEMDAADIEWGRVLAEYAGDCTAYLCRGAGVGETQQDARTRALLDEIHGVGGKWFKVRDLYRNLRAARNSRETWELIRSLDASGAVELQEGVPRKMPALVRCCCAACSAAAKGGA